MYFEASLHGLKERGGWGGRSPPFANRTISFFLPSFLFLVYYFSLTLYVCLSVFRSCFVLFLMLSISVFLSVCLPVCIYFFYSVVLSFSLSFFPSFLLSLFVFLACLRGDWGWGRRLPSPAQMRYASVHVLVCRCEKCLCPPPPHLVCVKTCPD